MTVGLDFASVTGQFRGELAHCYWLLGRGHGLLMPAITPAGLARIVNPLDPGLFRAFRLPQILDPAAETALASPGRTGDGCPGG